MNRRLVLYVAAALAAATALVVAVLAVDDDDGTAPGGAVAVRDLEDILASDIHFEWDPSTATGVLRLDTTVPVACSVVYGTDETFGALATDDDMAGAAHRDHSPSLTGLEPDTEYVYRVQGTAADGTVYAGEVMSFVTGVATGTEAANNLAPGGTIVDVSSEFSAAFAAANAIDGSPATEWSSAGDGDDAYIEVDLGEPQHVSGVGFRTREMSDGSAVTTSFTVTVDGGETFGPFEAGPGLSTADVDFTARIVRFDVETSTGGNTGAVEIEIYGDGG